MSQTFVYQSRIKPLFIILSINSLTLLDEDYRIGYEFICSLLSKKSNWSDNIIQYIHKYGYIKKNPDSNIW